MASDDRNMIAIYVIVPSVIFIVVVILVCFCCSRKYRLNWFERTLLEAHEKRDSEKEYINPATASTSTGVVQDHGSLHRCSVHSVRTQSSDRSSSITSGSIPSISHPLAGPQPPPLTTSKYSPLIEPPHIPPVISSHPSTPSSEKSGEQQFWVPPAILQKKRAQSLVPQLLQPQESTEDMGEHILYFHWSLHNIFRSVEWTPHVQRRIQDSP